MSLINLPVFLAWCALGVVALVEGLQASFWVKVGISITGLYLYWIGAIMQLFPNLGKRSP